MQLRGTVAAAAYGAQPDIAAWANTCALNPSRVTDDDRHRPDLQAARARLAEHGEEGLARMACLVQESPSVRAPSAL